MDYPETDMIYKVLNIKILCGKTLYLNPDLLLLVIIQFQNIKQIL